jgi:hypothetical protein
MLFFSSFHLTFSNLKFHGNELFGAVIEFGIHTLEFGLVYELDFLKLFFQVGYIPFKHIDLSLFLTDIVIMFLESLFFLMFEICLEAG